MSALQEVLTTAEQVDCAAEIAFHFKSCLSKTGLLIARFIFSTN